MQSGPTRLRSHLGKIEFHWQVVKQFSVLRRIFKAELYRYAKLGPRPSDVDCEELLADNLEPGSAAAAIAKGPSTDECIAHEILVTSDVASALTSAVIDTSVLNTPVMSSMSAARNMNAVMMALFSKQQAGYKQLSRTSQEG